MVSGIKHSQWHSAHPSCSAAMPWGSCSPMCGGPFDRSNWKSWVEQANDRGIPGIAQQCCTSWLTKKTWISFNEAIWNSDWNNGPILDQLPNLPIINPSWLRKKQLICAVSNKSPVCVGSYPHSSSTEAAPGGKADLSAEALEVGCHGDVRRAPGTLDRPGPCYIPGSIGRARWIQVARSPQI